MGVERQQGGLYQRLLFQEVEEGPRHDDCGNGRTEAAACEEPQTSTASNQARALTKYLMEEIVERHNLNRAYRRVKVSPGGLKPASCGRNWQPGC